MTKPNALSPDTYINCFELGWDDLPSLSADVTETHVFVEWVEEIDFHLKSWHDETILLFDDVMSNPGFGSAIGKWLNENYKNSFNGIEIEVYVEDHTDAFRFEMAKELPAEGMTLEDVCDFASGFAATMANVTDPGTFGHRYIIPAAYEVFEKMNTII